jgi:hypothetical protein
MANIDELSFSGILRFKLFWTMIVLCVLGVLLRVKRADPVDFFLLAFFVPVSVNVQRNVPIFAIVAAPMVAQYWHVHLKRLTDGLLNRLRTVREFPVSWKTCANVFVSLLLVTVTACALRRHHQSGILGCGIDDRWPGYPKEACDFVERNDLQGNIFNWDGFGSYFIRFSRGSLFPYLACEA